MILQTVLIVLIAASSILAQEQQTQFLAGRVLKSGGESAGPDSEVELVCNGSLQQTAFTDLHGFFNMMLDDSRSAIPGAAWRGLRSEDVPADFGRHCLIHISASRCRPAVIHLDPFSSEQHVQMGAVVLECAGSVAGLTISASALETPDRARRLREKAERARRVGKLTEARRFISQALIKYPEFAAGWIELGRIHLASGDSDSARSAFQRAAAVQRPVSPGLAKTEDIKK